MRSSKLKSVLAMVLAVLMVVSLAACAPAATSSVAGGSTSSAAGTPSTGATSSEAGGDDLYYNREGLPIVKEAIDVTMMSVSDYTKDWTNTYLFKWIGEKMGINITCQMYTQDTIKQQYALLLQSDELPDIPWWATGSMEEINEGYYLALDPYIEDGLMPNLLKLYEETPEAEALFKKADGKTYGFGNVRTDIVTRVLRHDAINTEWLKAVGKEVPTTLDELYEVLVAFRDQDPNGNGQPDEIPMSFTYDTARSGERMTWNLRASFGLFSTALSYMLVADKDGKVFLGEASENGKAYYKYLNKLYEEKLLDNELFSHSDDEYKEKIRKGVVGFFDTWGSTCQQLSDNKEEWPSIAEKWVMPGTFKSEWNDSQAIMIYNGAASGGVCISAKTEYPEALVRMFDYFLCEEGQIQYSYGTENVTFQWKEVAPGIKAPSCDIPEYIKAAGYETMNDYQIQYVRPSNFFTHYSYNAVNSVLKDYVADKDLKSILELKKYPDTVNNAIQAEALANYGVCYNYPMVSYTAEQSEARAQLQTDVNNYISTMKVQFITGEKDIDTEWDGYMAELKKMGLEDLLKIEQEAYDDYQALFN